MPSARYARSLDERLTREGDDPIYLPADLSPQRCGSHQPTHRSLMVAKTRAFTILCEFEHVQTELIGKCVALSDGKAGTVEQVYLDELHGLRITLRGHDGRWPVSTIKFTQS